MSAVVNLRNITPDDRKCAHEVLQHYTKYHEVDQPQSVEEGIALYIADRRARLKHLSPDELHNFFGAGLSKKKSYTRILPNHVSSKDKNFYVRLQAKPWFVRIRIPWLSHSHIRVISGLPTDLKGTPSLSGADVTPVSVSGGQQVSLYFKRWGKRFNLAIIGKKMAAEVAAWRLSEALGIGIVPRTELVMYKGEVGSGQQPVHARFRQGSDDAALTDIQNSLTDPRWQDAMAELNAFDYLTSNVDRSLANTFVDLARQEIQTIDHDAGFTFILPCIPSSDDFICGGRLPRQYSARLQVGIQNMTYPELKAALKDVLPKGEIEATWMRILIVRVHMLQKCQSAGSDTQEETQEVC